MSTYAQLLSFIYKGADKTERPYGNNTRIRLESDGKIIVRYHNTDICIILPDDTRSFYTGGWQTNTTKSRINELLPKPFGVYQKEYVWYVWNYETHETYVWSDGITIDSTGMVSGYKPLDDIQSLKMLDKQVKSYVTAYVNFLMSGRMPKPSQGDCMFCRFELPGSDHLLSHIDEKYYVPSIVLHVRQKLSRMALDGIMRLWQGEKLDTWQSDITREQVYKALLSHIRLELKKG